jgi:hypothetical protein
MIFRDIRKKELKQFIRSGEYASFSQWPVTPLRALSQAENPRAEDDDIVLILAIEEPYFLLGYVGLLPDVIRYNSINRRFFWNSCWWVDPVKGRKAAMPLLSRAMTLTNHAMFIFDMTPHTSQIIRALKQFDFYPPLQGVRIYLRSFFGPYSRKRIPSPRFISQLFEFADTMMNLPVSIIHHFSKKRLRNTRIYLSKLTSLTDDCEKFIKKHNSNELTQWGAKEFNWILSNPWVEETEEKQSDIPYFFTGNAGQFSQYVLKAEKNNHIAGLMFLTLKDARLIISYAYVEDQQAKNIAKALLLHSLEKKVISVDVSHPELIKYFSHEIRIPAYRKKIQKELAVPKKFSETGLDQASLQAGYGDAVFV